jgi:hypothetical protein
MLPVQMNNMLIGVNTLANPFIKKLDGPVPSGEARRSPVERLEAQYVNIS